MQELVGFSKKNLAVECLLSFIGLPAGYNANLILFILCHWDDL